MNDLNTQIAEAELVVECMGMQNTAGRSYADKIKQKAEYYNAIERLVALKRKNEFIETGDIKSLAP